jgi:hypothetical protein
MRKRKRLRVTHRKPQQSYGKRTRFHPFPYGRVANMWKKGWTIARIARAIDRVDKDNPKDPYHSLRNFLYRMHKGYVDERGRTVMLPHRVSKATVRAARRAGLRAK